MPNAPELPHKVKVAMTKDVIVLCSVCKQVPITLHPQKGYDEAKLWEGMMVCEDCAKGGTVK